MHWSRVMPVPLHFKPTCTHVIRSYKVTTKTFDQHTVAVYGTSHTLLFAILLFCFKLHLHLLAFIF